MEVHAVAKPKPLFITSHLPTSLKAGNLAYSHFLIELLSGIAGEVVVLVIGDRFVNHEFVVRDISSANTHYVTTFSKRVGGWQVLWGVRNWTRNVPRRLWAWLPSSVRSAVARLYFARTSEAPRRAFDPGIAARISALVDAHRCTHVIFDKLDHTKCLPTLPSGVRTGIVCHDLLQSRGDGGDARSEAGEYAKADFVIAIQPNEARLIAQQAPSRVFCVPYAPAEEASVESVAEDGVLFVGAGGAPNIGGLTWFIAEIWPLIRAERPDAALHVVGAVGTFVPHDAPGVYFHGAVPEVAPFYARARVVVVPLRMGSGLKIKLVEALGAGAACVTTGIGAQGMESGAGSAFLVEDDAPRFARAVIDLMGDAPRRTALRHAAIAFQRTHFGRSKAEAELRKAVAAPSVAEVA